MAYVGVTRSDDADAAKVSGTVVCSMSSRQCLEDGPPDDSDREDESDGKTTSLPPV